MWEEVIKEHETWRGVVRELIEEKLQDYEGVEVYGCDLAYTLFEGPNIDGSLTYSTYWSKELIKTYFDDFGEIYDNYIWSCGPESAINVFEEPEKFVVVMLLEEAQNILSETKFIDSKWNDEFKLTKANIKEIIKEIQPREQATIREIIEGAGGSEDDK